MVKVGVILLVILFDIMGFVGILKLCGVEINFNWVIVYGISVGVFAVLDLYAKEEITLGEFIRAVILVFMWPVVMVVGVVDMLTQVKWLKDIYLYKSKTVK
jgi:hypothetical protein